MNPRECTPLAPFCWYHDTCHVTDNGVILVTDDGRRFYNVREDSLIMAGAKGEFLSFEHAGSDRITYVPNVKSFHTENQE